MTGAWTSVTAETMPPPGHHNIVVRYSAGSTSLCCGSCVARYVALYGYPDYSWRPAGADEILEATT